MNKEQRVEVFAKELSWITNSELRNFAEHCLAEVPDYFFTIPASASGKHHPTYALGQGGLVRHTKAAIGIFHQLCKADIDLYYLADVFSDDLITREQLDDEIIVALMFHDCMKLGNTDHTVHEHPLLAAAFIENQAIKQNFHNGMAISRIASSIRSHMGKWSISRFSCFMLPTPDGGDWQAKLVHLCDYLASRKCIEYNFGAFIE